MFNFIWLALKHLRIWWYRAVEFGLIFTAHYQNNRKPIDWSAGRIINWQPYSPWPDTVQLYQCCWYTSICPLCCAQSFWCDIRMGDKPNTQNNLTRQYCEHNRPIYVYANDKTQQNHFVWFESFDEYVSCSFIHSFRILDEPHFLFVPLTFAVCSLVLLFHYGKLTVFAFDWLKSEPRNHLIFCYALPHSVRITFIYVNLMMKPRQIYLFE